MEPWILGVVSSVLAGVTLAALLAVWGMMRGFVKEQRAANEANSKANRSMQRDVLYRYFRIIVEEGKHVTPEEWSHVQECYEAYHANGGNGTGTLMFGKMQENVIIDTGRE